MKIFKRILVLVSLIFITLSLGACDKKDNKPEVKPEVKLTSVTLDQDFTNKLNLNNTVKPLSVQLDYLMVKKSENVIRLTINLENPKQHTILSLKIKDSKGASKLLDSSDRDELGNLVESNTFNWASRSNLKSEFLIELDVNSTPNDIEILEILYIDAESNQTIRADLNNKNVSRVYIYDAEFDITNLTKTLIGTRFDYSVAGDNVDKTSVEFFIKKGNSAPIKINNVKDNIVYANIFDNEELDETSYYNLYVKYNMTGELPESEKTVERLLISDFQLVQVDYYSSFNFADEGVVVGLYPYKPSNPNVDSLIRDTHLRLYINHNGERELLFKASPIMYPKNDVNAGVRYAQDFSIIKLPEVINFKDTHEYLSSLSLEEYSFEVEIYITHGGTERFYKMIELKNVSKSVENFRVYNQ